MRRKRILIVEDEEPALKYLSRIFAGLEFEITLARDGVEALDLFEKDPFPIVLTDLMMPKMGGLELIQCIKSIGFSPSFIVFSSQTEINTVIEVMKEGVVDYLIKPGSPEEILFKINKAFDLFSLNALKSSVEKEKEIRLQSQLSWLEWKGNAANKERDKFNLDLIQNLKHNFNQGGGIGALLSLIKMITSSIEVQGDRCTIDKEIVDLLVENGEIAEKSLKSLDEILEISHREIPLTSTPVFEVIFQITELNEEFEKLFALKRQQIRIAESNASIGNEKILWNRDFFKRAMKEILINSCKFSAQGSEISILFTIIDKKFNIGILSEPVPVGDIVGIPPEYERIIFEPFFRISRLVDEGFGTLDMGLGLALVEKIFKRQNAIIQLYNVRDHMSLSKDPIIKVLTRIDFPLQ